jgi:CRISPR-associated protein Cmr5
MPRYLKNIEQQRAKTAYQFVEGAKEFTFMGETNGVFFISSIFFQSYLEKKLIKKPDNKDLISEEILTFLNATPSERPVLCHHKTFDNYQKVINDFADDYKSYVKKIPMMIKNNGLSNAFAFVLSKAKDGNAYTLIDRQTREWFGKTEQPSFVAYLLTLDTLEYRKTTIEVLAFFSWLKRFADGLIETDEEQSKTEGGQDGN